MSGNYLNYIQILTDNFMVESSASLSLRGSSSTKPISRKFGGTGSNPVSWRNSGSGRAVKTDLTFYSGNLWYGDIDLRSQKRSTNCLLFVSSTSPDISPEWEGIIECNVSNSFPSSLNSQSSYTPDDVFFFRRASANIFYVNLPRNLSYRYYRIKLFNPESVSTSGTISLNDIFLGDSVDIDRAPARGVNHQTVDPSTEFLAESGRQYFLRKTKYQNIGSIELPLLKRWQVSSIKIWSDQVGTTDPFWMVLDPSGAWDGPVYGATFGIYRLSQMPNFTHQFTDHWSCSLSFREAI